MIVEHLARYPRKVSPIMDGVGQGALTRIRAAKPTCG